MLGKRAESVSRWHVEQAARLCLRSVLPLFPPVFRGAEGLSGGPSEGEVQFIRPSRRLGPLHLCAGNLWALHGLCRRPGLAGTARWGRWYGWCSSVHHPACATLSLPRAGGASSLPTCLWGN